MPQSPPGTGLILTEPVWYGKSQKSTHQRLAGIRLPIPSRPAYPRPLTWYRVGRFLAALYLLPARRRRPSPAHMVACAASTG